jgi:hypothetical protein
MAGALMRPHGGVGRSARSLTHAASALARVLSPAWPCDRLSAPLGDGYGG